jgi:2-hydroxychromene-2-carboxylate isomerase
MADLAVKEWLRGATEKAIARDVFGSPNVILDGELFWGCDRLDQVDRWLKTGGW